MTSSRPSRRGLLGYAGAGGAGLLAGVGGALALSGQDEAVATVSPTVPGRISPYGLHQPGVTSRTPRANRLLALDLRRDVDAEALGRLMRQWTGTIEAATQGHAPPGDTIRDLAQDNVDLSVVVGWGPRLFRRLGLAAPGGLSPVPAFRHDKLLERWNGGDLLVMVGAADDTSVVHLVRRLMLDAEPFARPRWEQVGSWRGLAADQAPTTGRNLFGQVDGTGNLRPEDPLFDSTVWAKTPDWFAGGTTLVVRRIEMDLDVWESLTRDEMERSVGRDLDTGAPLTGGSERDQPDLSARDSGGRLIVPADSHVRRSHPSQNGGARILRRGLNYTEFDAASGRSHAGLIFCSFQADIATQFVPLQQRLDEGDALNEWTTAIGSAEFAILPGFERGGWLGERLLG